VRRQPGGRLDLRREIPGKILYQNPRGVRIL
jgi:hypothetical protein